MPRHEFAVKMNCSGCSGAVTRVLTKLAGRLLLGCRTYLTQQWSAGVEKVECNLETQRVYVDSELPSESLLATIQKTGKVRAAALGGIALTGICRKRAMSALFDEAHSL